MKYHWKEKGLAVHKSEVVKVTILVTPQNGQ